ncbi:MAG TPA: exodeoxyribonuclease VII small subunit [Nitrospinota bacterium]|jgi:exodeoxyribonuclease VII small subunit|nr:exodeoxyribonuclease VII small subunit [Nitrospinota bacterium]
MAGLSFEKALERLEEIVENLENSDLDIDKSLKAFEEGVKLSRLCAKKLEEAEKKIELLIKGEKGEFITELFSPPNKEDD